MHNDLMLSGMNALTLDDKGRLALPARFRQILKDNSERQVVVTRSIFDTCLWIYPGFVFTEVSKSLSRLPVAKNRSWRALQRVVMGSAVPLDLDASGRVLVPAKLREFAGLEHELVLIGLNTKFELWSQERYEACEDEDLAMLKNGEIAPPDDLLL